MGRYPKRKLDYVGWPVDMFDNDTKLDKLIEEAGWQGFCVYFFLCMRAYGSEGYFYRWSFDDIATTSRKMGGDMTADIIKNAVLACLKVSLFDAGLFERFGIITSLEIQRRYYEVARERRVLNIEQDYWLLDLSATNADLSPLKESKEKKSKENESYSREKLESQFGAEKTELYLGKAKKYGYKGDKAIESARLWLLEDFPKSKKCPYTQEDFDRFALASMPWLEKSGDNDGG